MQFEKAEEALRRRLNVDGMLTEFLSSGLNSARVIGWEKYYATFHGAYVSLKRGADRVGKVDISQRKGNIYLKRKETV